MTEAKSTVQSENKPAALQCLEIWGGNHSVSHALELPGLTGWLHSEPTEQSSHGGDVHYVSVCSKGVLTRLALADVSGHGQSAGSVAALLRSLIRKQKHDKAGIKGDSPRIGDSLICQNSACGEKFKIKELKLKSGPLKGSYRLIAGPDWRSGRAKPEWPTMIYSRAIRRLKVGELR